MTKEIIHYSEEELKQLSDSELVSKVYGLAIRLSDLNQYLICQIPELKEEIVRRTSFLDIDYKHERNDECVPITARLYCLANGLKSTPQCSKENCHKVVGWNKSKGIFREYCSGTCRSSDTKFKDKVKISKQTPEYLEKMVSVNNRKSELMKSEEMRERIKHSCQINLGVDHPMKSNVVVEHRKEIWREKLGCDNPMHSQEIMEKRRQEFKARHGVENPAQLDEIKKKISEAHKSDKCKAKINSTCEKRYGTKWYQQSEEYYKNRKWRYTNPKYPDITFATSWEFKVYDFLREHNIPFGYQVKSIPYKYDNKTHYYHPDFLINGRLYEVKGDNFFRINKETGKEEMYLTWRGNLSDEEYEWRCGLEEAKHQCMLANNVIILRKDDINHLNVTTFHQ